MIGIRRGGDRFQDVLTDVLCDYDPFFSGYCSCDLPVRLDGTFMLQFNIRNDIMDEITCSTNLFGDLTNISDITTGPHITLCRSFAVTEED